tara:strand:+ start:153 stop:431 length:279 start_codon:yes stop_codon:yes gene_type:complete
MGGRRFKKIKLTKKGKKKKKDKIIIDKKRKIGELPGKITIYGSESQLINPLSIESVAPFEILDEKEKEYNKRELYVFKKYTNNNLYIDLWNE